MGRGWWTGLQSAVHSRSHPRRRALPKCGPSRARRNTRATSHHRRRCQPKRLNVGRGAGLSAAEKAQRSDDGVAASVSRSTLGIRVGVGKPKGSKIRGVVHPPNPRKAEELSHADLFVVRTRAIWTCCSSCAISSSRVFARALKVARRSTGAERGG